MTIQMRRPTGLELAICAVVGAVIVLAIGPTVASRRLSNQDAVARSALEIATYHADRYVTDNKTVVGMVPALLASRRSTVWTVDPALATAPTVHVALIGPTNQETAYVLSTRSGSGVFSYVKTLDGTVYRCTGDGAATAADGCVAPYSETW